MPRRSLGLLLCLCVLLLASSNLSNAQTPGEVTNVQWCSGGSKVCLQWTPTATSTTFHVNRGNGAGLPALLTSAADSCERSFVITNSSSTADSPAPGELFWYLVVAANSCGTGTAGPATPGPRILDASGNCEPACSDGVKDLAESDVDCGGGACPLCADLHACGSSKDCASFRCVGGVCQQPTCSDVVENGAETGIDCGGGPCPNCGNGAGCCGASDCQSQVCANGGCTILSCTNGVVDGNETGLDCGGGTCPACANSVPCVLPSDCQTGNCQAGTCQPGILPNGAACASGGQCGSGNCVDGVCCDTACAGTCQACSAARKGSGTDGTCGNIANGTDPDDDCSGITLCNGSGACTTLANGTACTLNAECQSGNCVDGACCNTACAGACQACSAAKKGNGTDGTCGNITNGTDPDNECAGSIACNGSGACATLANGTACSLNAECQSGSCVDGVCCNTACTGTCQACSAVKKGNGTDGTCGNISTGTDPDNECAGATVCNGSGACNTLATGAACTLAAECFLGRCVDGFCCNSDCPGTCRACSAAKKGSGTDGTCGSIANATDPDNECVGATVCNGNGMCTTLAIGTACTLNAECQLPGNCVDGVCCNGPCSGPCTACSAAKKGSGVDGICGDIANGTDPDNECAGSSACSGSGACAAVDGSSCTTNAQCLSLKCIDAVCCSMPCGNRCQACSAAKKGSGADGTCGNIASGTDPDNECAGTTVCDGSGMCTTLANGAACTLNAECSSGICVDDLCCNSLCTGTCQACSTARKGNGADGTCGNISSGSDPDNECAGTTVCNGSGSCAAADGSSCSTPAQCASGNCVDGVCCNTACNGACQACSAVKKGSGADGTCGDIVSGTDPDNECAGTTVCNGSGACATLANGTACTLNAECLSGSCVDGVCCNTSCSGVCQACSAAKKGSGADGTCGDIVSGTDPDNECAGSSVCNGSGSCVVANGSSCTAPAQCLSLNCVDGFCCNSACTGTCQACSAAKKGSGTDGTCGNIVAATDPDNECAGTTVCNGGGACVAADGSACTTPAQCLSANCVDGVCCNAACNGACQACSAAKKGSGADGTCGNIGSGTDPDNECAGTTVCNGSGACATLANGTACTINAECTSGSCVDGFCCNSSCTGTCQACSAAKKGSGANGTCGNIGSGTDPDNECSGASVCNGSGACATLSNGTACTLNTECISGSCVDGFCCNSTCNGVCQACSAAKKGSGVNGACGNIANGTDPDSECSGTAVCNGSGACVGQLGAHCTVDTQCVSGNCVDTVCCNTACTALCQACSAGKKGSGADGTCGNIAFDTDPDNECAGINVCSGTGTCVPPP